MNRASKYPGSWGPGSTLPGTPRNEHLTPASCAGLPAFLNPDSIWINFLGYEMDHWCAVQNLTELPFSVQVSPAGN